MIHMHIFYLNKKKLKWKDRNTLSLQSFINIKYYIIIRYCLSGFRKYLSILDSIMSLKMKTAASFYMQSSKLVSIKRLKDRQRCWCCLK